MTNPIGKNVGSTDKTSRMEEEFEDYSDFNFEEEALEDNDEGDYLDVSQLKPEADATEIRKRIQWMEGSIRQNPNLGEGEKRKMLEKLEELRGRVNRAVSLDPTQKESELTAVNGAIGEVEAQSLKDSSLTEADGVEGKEGMDENSLKGLQEQAKKIKTKLGKMLSDGKIAQRVYDALKEKLSRVESALKTGAEGEEGQLETIAGSLNEIQENLQLMESHYLINGEQITEIPGEDGDKIKKEELPESMRKLIDAVPGMTVEKFLKKLQASFPDIDSNGDGKLSFKEIQDGANAKLFPPSQPNNNLMKFLTELDSDLKDKWESTKRDYQGYEIQGYVSSMYKATERAVTLLNSLYPNRLRMYWGPDELQPHKFGPKYYELSDDIIFVDENGKSQILNLFNHSTKDRNIEVFFEGESDRAY